MNLAISPQILDDFLNITGGDVRSFLINYYLFYQSDYIEISNFYQGKSKSIEKDSFKNFKLLKDELIDMLNKFQEFNMQLENIKFVELLNTLEECNDVLQTLNNINRWARSSRDIFGYNPTIKKQFVLSQNSSLELIANNILLSNDPQNDWYGIAIENNLSEDDYTTQGGKILDITMENNNNTNMQINSVVDIMKGKSVFGRDVDQNIHFKDDDIAYLNEDDTIIQAISILTKLKKRDNLDFLNHGLQSNLIVGQNKSLFNFPIVERQMQDTFANDDTLKNFRLTQFRFEQDSIYIEFEVENRLNEVMQLNSIL